ncbi:MAG: tetratricopeptide repeat protein [Pseudomonadota bacterium]
MFRRAFVIMGGLAAFGVALYAFFMLSPVRLDPAVARASVQKGAALLAEDNVTAARAAALAAVRSDPNSGEAHLLLARTQLRLGDGVGADAELKRANDGGIDPKLTHHLRAQALVLEGEPEKALAEADKTDPEFRADGLRMRARALAGLGRFGDAQAALAQAVQAAPGDARVWTDLGRLRFVSGNIAGAIEASQRAVQLDGGDIDALVLRGELVRTQYGLVAALPWFENALKRDPAYHDALIQYAATLGEAGRTTEMLAATRRALEARPGSAQAFYLQSVLAARAGNYDLARTLLQKTGGSIDSLPGVLLLGGTLDLEEGDTEQAIEKLRQLVDMQPDNATARTLFAAALMRSDSSRNALDVLRPLVLRGDADSYALTLAARGFERIGDRAQASRFLDRAAFPSRGDSAAFGTGDAPAALAAAAQQRPGDPGAVVPYIRALLASGDGNAAFARARQFARANPGAPPALLALGDMLMVAGRPGEAAGVYKQAADLRFDEPTLLRLVEALGRAGRSAEASTALALFLSQNPANVAALRLSAHWQLASGQTDAAIDTLEGLRARLGDRDAAIQADLAAAYAAVGEADKAEEHGRAAYALAPANPAAADAYGWALFQGGDLPGALDLLQKAVVLAPRHAGLRWHLAQVYAEMKRNPEARAEAQAALADPGFTERAAATALIAKAT